MSFRRKHERVTFQSDLPSRTIQAPRDETDINILMAKYKKTGMINHFAKNPPRFEDVSGAVSFHEAMNIVNKAEELFMGLSASVRSRFQNDPGKFMEFMQDPSNAEEMVKLGLADLVPPPETPKVDLSEAAIAAISGAGQDEPVSSKKSSKSSRNGD